MDEAAVVPLGTVALEEVLARAGLVLGVVVLWDTSRSSSTSASFSEFGIVMLSGKLQRAAGHRILSCTRRAN